MNGAAPAAAPAAAPPRLVAVVVTHNRLAQLQTTLARLLAEPVARLVVVDNASTDGTGAWLAGLAEARLTVVTPAQNLGGAGGFQTGLARARQLEPQAWAVVMDDDARPQAGALARFLAEAAALGAAGWEALAGGVFYPDGAICEMNRPSRNPFWHLREFVRTALGGGRRGFHLPDAAYGATAPVPVDAASFVGLFLSPAALARAGLPDGRLFLYGDDVLYTLGLTRAGGRIGFAPWIGFEHDCSTFHADPGVVRVFNPLWKVYYNYRNGLLAYRQAAGPVLFWPVLALVVPLWLAKSRAYGAQGPRFRRLLGLAVGDALRGNRDRPHAEILARASLP